MVSRASSPQMAPSNIAASVIVRHMGPAVSCEWAMGIMPARLTAPSVGLMPTNPFADDGHTIDPSVSVPIPTAAKFPLMAAPVPELDPQGLRSSAYGFFVCPPRPDHPLLEWLLRMFAHSERFV